MKRFVLLFVASVFFSSAVSRADEGTAAIALKNLVSSGYKSMTSDKPIYNLHNKKWVKRQHTVSNVTYDIKKGNSIRNAINGLVTFAAHIDESRTVSSKEEALQLTTFSKSPLKYDVSLKYVYENGAWKFQNSHVRTFFNGKYLIESELTKEDIMYGHFIVPLRYWMPRE
jgi:hypothetical protein